MKKIIFVMMVLGLMLLVLGCSQTTVVNEVPAAPNASVIEQNAPTTPATTAAADANQIVIKDSRFNPTNLEVKVGNPIEWVNNDGVTHTVSFENGDVDEQIVSGGTFVHTFTEKGEFRYFCSIHPGMQGSVIVS